MRETRGRLFGTDGARGLANADLTAALALRIGRAFGGWIAAQEPSAQVLLARDTRVSGPMLSAAVAAGLCSAGVQVVDCGVLTTPALCLLTRAQGRAGGVVISASHNPPAFNGVKLVGPSGDKLSDEAAVEIEEAVFAEEDLAPTPTGSRVGGIEPAEGAEEQYLDLLFKHDPPAASLQGLRVLLDCCYGAAYRLAPEALARAGAEVTTLNATPDGTKINVDCGSLYPEQLAEAVRAQGADLGVAFDGDGDRAMLVDADGTVRDGDFTKLVLAQDLQERGALEPPLVVGTVMSNLGLELALRELGIGLLRAPVGDRYVADEMRSSGAVLGGEQSGHIVFGRMGVGDGILTALRVCEVLVRTGRTFAELCASLRKVPQTLINVPVKDKHSWEHSERLREELAKWQARLADRGRVLVRASGTEPLVRVMVEALDHGLAVRAAEDLGDIIATEFGYGQLLSEPEA